MNKLSKFALITGLTLFGSLSQAAPLQCADKDFTLQLLGSGGPISDDGRASSGEIIWWNNKPLALIDVGGGVFLRFGQSGAKVEDLKVMGLSHFHTDHVADVAALLKGSYFFSNDTALEVVGPTGGNGFPSTNQFLDRLFKKNEGAFEYLSGLFDATDGLKLALKPIIEVDVHKTVATTVYDKDQIKISALGIPHGDVPALAFRIETPKGVIVVSADQNGSNKDFLDFARNADILVMPLAITEDADETSTFMHAKPSIVGKIAAEVNPKLLVLNHFMGKSLVEKDKDIQIVRQYYKGPIDAGRDLSCFPVTETGEN